MHPKASRILDALSFSEYKFARALNISRRKARALLIAFEQDDEDVLGLQGGNELMELIADQLAKSIVVRWELRQRQRAFRSAKLT